MKWLYVFLILIQFCFSKGVLDAAIAAIKNEKYKKAEFLLEHARKQGIQPLLVEYNLAYLYFRTGRVQSAINQYEKLLKSAPEFKQAYHNIGRIYYQYRDYVSAIRVFNRYLQVDNADKETHLLLGDVHKKIRNYGPSEFHYTQANQLDKRDGAPYLALADLYIEVDNDERALETVKLAMLEVSNVVPLLEKETEIYLQQKKYLDAAVTLEQLLRDQGVVQEDRYFILLQMANHYIDAKFPEQALKALSKALDLYPKRKESLELYSYVLTTEERWEEAANLYERVFTHQRKDAYLGMRDILTHAYNEEDFYLQKKVLDFYERNKLRDELYDLVKREIQKTRGVPR